LLTRTVEAIGAISPILPDHIRLLTVGDRERLVLALHAASFGPQVETLTICDACGTTNEVTLDLLDALVPPDGAGADQHFSLYGLNVQFRCPNGADQERAAAVAKVDPAAAEAILLAACVLSVTDAGGRQAQIEGPPLISALEDAVRLADPDAESIVAVACAGCDQRVVAVADAFALLHGALRTGRSVLDDVHRLAACYHWTEDAILSLPTERRRHYLALLGRDHAA